MDQPSPIKAPQASPTPHFDALVQRARAQTAAHKALYSDIAMKPEATEGAGAPDKVAKTPASSGLGKRVSKKQRMAAVGSKNEPARRRIGKDAKRGPSRDLDREGNTTP